MEKVHFISILIFSSFALVSCVDWDVVTPLDQYVHSDDGYFHWEEIASYNYNTTTVYVINMTSQMYQTDEYSTRSIWWHYMGIAIPETIRYPNAAMMLIDGGGNEGYQGPGEGDSGNVGIALAARDSGMITAYVKSVPNQPIYFHNDPDFRRRTEDSLIAWTWRTYMDMLDTRDPTVVIRHPMTKSGKRGLDTINEVVKIKIPGSDVNRFLVTGASKRGWTTWSLAATDPRVIAIVPLVFSLINMDDALMSHNRNMNGDWSFALGPYWRENLTQEFHNPVRLGIWQSEDMYMYKERFTMPIFAMSSTGDEFFLADDNHNWWDDFPEGNKYLLMLPNAEHTMVPHYPKIYESAMSFAKMVLEGRKLPSLKWKMGETETGGYIDLDVDTPPTTIRAWRAVTPNNGRREFRLASLTSSGSVAPQLIPWRANNINVENLGNGKYRCTTDRVDGRWVGFFIEGIWEGVPGLYNYRLALTTQVNIIPYTYPRDACTDAQSCWGILI